jgi:hypothetical protein
VTAGSSAPCGQFLIQALQAGLHGDMYRASFDAAAPYAIFGWLLGLA